MRLRPYQRPSHPALFASLNLRTYSGIVRDHRVVSGKFGGSRHFQRFYALLKRHVTARTIPPRHAALSLGLRVIGAALCRVTIDHRHRILCRPLKYHFGVLSLLFSPGHREKRPVIITITGPATHGLLRRNIYATTTTTREI